MSSQEPKMAGGCQCGAVRYALFAAPESTVCHCRMCQKAVGGPFAAFCKVPSVDFAWTRGQPASFNSSSVARRHFCAACGTPLTFQYLDGDAIEVTTGSLDQPAGLPPTKNYGVEARLPWIDLLLAGRLPDTPTSESSSAAKVIVNHQHPDHATPA
ncbi:GFA family protein [Rhodopila sp.]|uniref:GFA family protein n=1 Tax=Rhodopila sp. TaxID=2480087 RepID=UPI003D10727B